MTVAVSCKGITKKFITKDIEIEALRGIDLTINKGEFLLLVGPSGCGKTTLISIIAGILKPTMGICTVEGINYGAVSDADLLDFRSKKIGFIFQSFNLIPTLNLLENIALPLIINGHPQEYALTQAKNHLNIVGLAAKENRSPTQLSGGEQQRVAIARSLVHKPSLVICDEPTSALDHATGTSIMDLMRDINRTLKTTFAIVTHDPRIYTYADRIVHMDDGAVVNS